MDGANFVTKKDPKNRGFMVKQDRYLLAKMQFCDAEKKPRTYWTYWWKVTKFFHEPWKFSPYNIYSDGGQVSIQKRWTFIQVECNNLCGANKHVLGRLVNGLKPRPF
jgi:hypothetical protein